VKIYGASLEVLQETKCKEFLGWLLGEKEPSDLKAQLRWALLFCVDGVVWGRLEGGKWILSSMIFPEICPEPSAEKILEFRIFGPEAEILVWRAENVFKGRLLKEEVERDIFLPAQETRVLLGNKLLEKSKGGFSRVGSPEGREQVVPLECSFEDFKDGRWPLRLLLKHYFVRVEETGALRVAVSRLVDVYKEDQNGA